MSSDSRTWKANFKEPNRISRQPNRYDLVKLGYSIEGEWKPVAHFDHNPAGTDGHDVAEEGLHADSYRDGKRTRTKSDFPPVPLCRAPDYCISYIENNANSPHARLVRR